ncbi:putative pectinesterase/pectinesterase inhibitor 36 [Citrus sinensis]|nr:putative pectinesterase/pectinesterase inhibitor 36 [Citrus sinensis]
MSSFITTKMSISLPTFLHLLLLAMALTTTSCTDELAAVQSARAAALQARNWARASIAPNGLDESRLASLLHLASDNYTTDDARTWLSSSLACRRTCLEGLEEKGRAQTHARAHNLTVLLGEALNLHARGRGFRKGRFSWHSQNNQRSMNNTMFVGDGIDRTIVTGHRNVPDGSTTSSPATFGVSGDGFWARDMTFENTAGPQKHEAVALRVSSDLSMFYRCSFKDYQDTLFTLSLRQFYRDCQIYGTIDFIVGDAAAVFQNFDIFVRRPMHDQSNMVTAQGRDNPNENTGISIEGSRIRPAADLAATDLDGIIHPEGWIEWDGNFALSTLYYAEYLNAGLGASTANRVKWPGFHVLNNPQQAAPFTVTGFIQGDSWIPATGVPFWLGI